MIKEKKYVIVHSHDKIINGKEIHVKAYLRKLPDFWDKFFGK